ncbi:hypothetical protein GCM10023093_25230 [Nemorincola caseinilytica]|uniref:HTH araC/xylS-type domain-containing protein n=1 Tax=Nemorincola caseinilytica TaxID=2054315 RepID=A0ABP8NMM4_9BACT
MVVLLNSFPDINMIRQLKNNAARGENEWRNVVLNFSCGQASRLDLESPYSLFLNRTGHSHCKVNRDHYRVETDTYLFSQPGDLYGLTIDNLHKTEICNIHICKRFFEGVAHSLTHTHAAQLDAPDDMATNARFVTQLYRKDEALNAILDRLIAPGTYKEGLFEPVLMQLVEHLLLQNEDVRKSISKLPFVKAAVRSDIYRRLALAKDIIHSGYTGPLDLDSICRETGMSKFHFLRLFKVQYRLTPHQYLTEVRMQKGLQMLEHSGESISAIAAHLGYEYPNSFIKAFRKTYDISPLQYRKSEISNFG